VVLLPVIRAALSRRRSTDRRNTKELV
jgi:hypothetical protein